MDDAILDNGERGHRCFDVIRHGIMWVTISRDGIWDTELRFAICANLDRGVAPCTSDETGAWTEF